MNLTNCMNVKALLIVGICIIASYCNAEITLQTIASEIAVPGQLWTCECSATASSGNPVSFRATGGFSLNQARYVELPDWLTFQDNGDGTARVSGSPDASHIGTSQQVVIWVDASGETETGQYQTCKVRANIVARAPKDIVVHTGETWSDTIEVGAYSEYPTTNAFTVETIDLPDWLSITQDGTNVTLSGTCPEDAGDAFPSITYTRDGFSLSHSFNIYFLSDPKLNLYPDIDGDILSDGLLITGDWDDDFNQFIEIHDSATMELLGRYDVPDNSFSVVNDGSLRYSPEHNLLVAGELEDSKIAIIDLSNPAQPDVKCIYDFSDSYRYYTRLVLVGSGVYLFYYSDDLESQAFDVMDLSDPANPQIIQTVSVDNGDLFVDAKAHGDKMAMLFYGTGWDNEQGMLHGYFWRLYDCTDISVPTLLASSSFSYYAFWDRSDWWRSLHFDGNCIAVDYIEYDDMGNEPHYLRVFDLAGNQTAHTKIADYWGEFQVLAQIGNVYAWGNVYDYDSGFSGLRLKSLHPSNEIIHSFDSVDGSSITEFNLSSDGRRAYLSSDGGLYTYQLTDPSISEPIICSFTNGFNLVFGPCDDGKNYVCEWSTNLTATSDWSVFEGTVTTNGENREVQLPETAPFTTSPAIFLRVSTQ